MDRRPLIDDFKNAILSLDRISARKLVEELRSSPESDALDVETLIVHTLEEIGEEWDRGGLSLAQVYMCGLLCEELTESLLPTGLSSRRNSPRLGIAMLGDHHVLGKRIVSSILKAQGYSLTDFGEGLSPAEIAEKCSVHRIDILLISTLMLHSAYRVRDLRKELEARQEHPFILVGGAPFRLSPGLWREVGADGTCALATEILPLLENFSREEYP